MRKKEFPIWFKVETMIFLFFSGAVVISYFQNEDIVNSKSLLTKLLILLTSILLIWFVSLIACCFKD